MQRPMLRDCVYCDELVRMLLPMWSKVLLLRIENNNNECKRKDKLLGVFCWILALVHSIYAHVRTRTLDPALR